MESGGGSPGRKKRNSAPEIRPISLAIPPAAEKRSREGPTQGGISNRSSNAAATNGGSSRNRPGSPQRKAGMKEEADDQLSSRSSVNSTRGDRLRALEQALVEERQARDMDKKEREVQVNEIRDLLRSVHDTIRGSSARGDISPFPMVPEPGRNAVSPPPSRLLMSVPPFGSSRSQRVSTFTNRSIRTRFYRDYYGRILFTDKFLDPFVPM